MADEFNGQRALELILKNTTDNATELRITRDQITAMRVQMVNLASKEDVNCLIREMMNKLSALEIKHEVLKSEYKTRSTLLATISAVLVSIGMGILHVFKK